MLKEVSQDKMQPENHHFTEYEAGCEGGASSEHGSIKALMQLRTQ